MTDMDLKVIALIAGFFIIVIYVAIDNKRKYNAKLINRLKNEWGKPGKREHSREEYDNILHYFRDTFEEKNDIDDITWNDLNMDAVFNTINTTNSSIGQEYLYKTLRTPVQDEEKLKKMDRLADYFTSHEKERIQVQKRFASFGFVKKISLSDYIGLVTDLKSGNNTIHYILLLAEILSFVICFTVNPVVGVAMIVICVAVMIGTYYKMKAQVERYFVCVTQFINLVGVSEKISSDGIDGLKEYSEQLKTIAGRFSKVTGKSWILEKGNVTGSLAEMVMIYVRMLTHIDLIHFNSMIRVLNKKEEDARQLMDILGFIETSIAVGSFRQMLAYYSVPEFSDDGSMRLDVQEVFHPLIKDPVANSLDTDRNILLTGSNASGKSTFLRTIAINALLSQTIYTSVSKKYTAPRFRIFSSMSLKDDLSSNSSYYIVEIRSLKRILDIIEPGGCPVLCFVDEVLRGTNTVERIAASSEILKYIYGKNALCFAATHDIELTSILQKYYTNYHFQEEVTDDDVKFNFTLFKGPATTRNAIKLLKIMGYDKRIVEHAETNAAHFIDTGLWK